MSVQTRKRQRAEHLPLTAAILCSADDRSALLSALRGAARVEFFDSASEAERVLRQLKPVAVFLQQTDADGVAAEHVVSRLRPLTPRTPLVVLVDVGHDAADALAISAVALDVVRLSDPAFNTRIRAIVRSAVRRLRLRAYAVHVAAEVSPEIRDAVCSAIEHACSPRSVRELSASVGIPRKTLDRRLARRLGVSARQLIGWGRLIAAAICLEDPAVTVPIMSDELGFASPAAFRNLLQRYAAMTPTQLRTTGGAPHLQDRVCAAVRARTQA